ncbi:DoxX family protein [Pseudoroseicyclus aestuarii]|uniref:Putative oxidoreductase n=1 Tax=Pseudoroseicyclus aestuarii TaxID=1795041 RepID=A0A318SND7_9RHOB|nr:DoxX family protein [Pseudoroseicyclus aestuarii]PYE81382.1 putative oxidoreductase [Pseudoroseicyclus aestuarii]
MTTSPSALAPWAPKLLSVLRIVAGLMFMAHGTQKLLGFPASEMMPEAFSFMWWGGLLELVGGALFALGLFTTPVGILISGEMAVAYWMFHAPSHWVPAANGGDASILYCFVFLYIAAAGPGPWSLDAARKRA